MIYFLNKLLAIWVIATIAFPMVASATPSQDPLTQFLNSSGEKPLTQEERDVAHELGVSDSDLYQVSQPMTREAKDAVKRDMVNTVQDLEAFSHKTDVALAKLIERTAYVLNYKGYEEEAKQLTAEYAQFYTRAVYYTYLGIVPVELGDHKPLNQWLADWYDRVEANLGVRLCKILHIIDIKILNYGIPVVFNPKGRPALGEVYTLNSYMDHFGGHMTGKYAFAYHGVGGVAAYWTTYISCVGATFGGGVAFICGTIGNGIQWGFDKYISPPVSKRIYCNANGASAAGCATK